MSGGDKPDHAIKPAAETGRPDANHARCEETSMTRASDRNLFYAETARAMKANARKCGTSRNPSDRVAVSRFLNMVNDALYYSEAARAYVEMEFDARCLHQYDGAEWTREIADLRLTFERLDDATAALNRRIHRIAPEWL